MNYHQNSIRYSINAADEIVTVGGDWDRFALENDSPAELFSGSVLHRSFWDFVSGDAIQHVYRRIMDRVRAGETLDFAFRCDSPGLRRFLSLRMERTDNGGIDFVTETICTEKREFQSLFDIKAERSEELVVACSWCNKLRTPADVWQEAEEAVITLSLFETDAIPVLSHGLCDQCYEHIMDKTIAKNTVQCRTLSTGASAVDGTLLVDRTLPNEKFELLHWKRSAE